MGAKRAHRERSWGALTTPFALLSAVGAHGKLKVGAAERIWGASGARTLKVHFAHCSSVVASIFNLLFMIQ